ncbi:hypothetical protein PM082_020276 [Marasmius tenuissimus]|nr:hypothetical protein PM082_020276 [Marasmius tenuissimus]
MLLGLRRWHQTFIGVCAGWDDSLVREADPTGEPPPRIKSTLHAVLKFGLCSRVLKQFTSSRSYRISNLRARLPETVRLLMSFDETRGITGYFMLFVANEAPFGSPDKIG